MDKSNNNDLEKQMKKIFIDKDVAKGVGKVVRMQNEGTAPNFVRVAKTEQGNITYTPQQRPVRKTKYQKQATEEELAQIEAEMKAEEESLRATKARYEALKREKEATERYNQRKAAEKQAKKDAKLINKIEKDYDKKHPKKARFTTSKSKLQALKEKAKANSKKIVIASIVAAGIGVATLGAHDFKQHYIDQHTISTSNVSVLANDNEKLDEANVSKTDALELIELTNNVNEMIEDGSYKNLTQEQINELANETRDVTADILKQKALAYYNEGKPVEDQMEYKNIVISAPSRDDGRIRIYQKEYYGFPNIEGSIDHNVMMYAPDQGLTHRDAYVDYANLCIAMDNNDVTFDDITHVIESTNAASTQTFKEYGIVDKRVSLDDSVVSKKEIKNYEEKHRAEEKDESEISTEQESASINNMLDTSILSSEDIDIDDEER